MVIKSKYIIWGKIIEFVSNDRILSWVDKEFSLYPSSDKNEKADFRIVITQDERIIQGYESRNPSVHYEYEDGFAFDYGSYAVRFRFVDNNVVESILLFRHRKKLRELLSKWISIQYSSIYEMIGQIIHENILYNSLFWLGLVPIHASSILVDNKLLVFGGAGGVGKSSLLISTALYQGKSVRFYSDDFLIVDVNGKAFPNMAYPKIYAYNVEGLESIKKKIFSGSSLGNKVHWSIRKIWGKNKVRRRVSPDVFWEIPSISNLVKGNPIYAYFLLNRGDYSDIRVVKISDHTYVADLNVNIMVTELYDLLRHMYWHKYNRLLMNKQPIVDTKNIWNFWKQGYEKAFMSTNLYRIDIPFDISHVELLDFYNGFISQFA